MRRSPDPATARESLTALPAYPNLRAVPTAENERATDRVMLLTGVLTYLVFGALGLVVLAALLLFASMGQVLQLGERLGLK